MNRGLIAASVVLFTAVAGCMPSTRKDAGVAWVSPGDHRIVFAAAGFKTTRPIRVQYADSWQTEEYALFKAEGWQVEIVYGQVF